MTELTDSRFLTTCEDCTHNDDCPCVWSIGCSTCILIQEKIEEN